MLKGACCGEHRWLVACMLRPLFTQAATSQWLCMAEVLAWGPWPPILNSSDRQSLLQYFLSTVLFPLSPSFCLSFQRCQDCVTSWKLFPPISAPSFFDFMSYWPIKSLSISDAYWHQCVDGPELAWVVSSPSQVAAMSYTTRTSMPNLWSQLVELGVVKRVRMALIDLNSSILYN